MKYLAGRQAPEAGLRTFSVGRSVARSKKLLRHLFHAQFRNPIQIAAHVFTSSLLQPGWIKRYIPYTQRAETNNRRGSRTGPNPFSTIRHHPSFIRFSRRNNRRRVLAPGSALRFPSINSIYMIYCRRVKSTLAFKAVFYHKIC